MATYVALLRGINVGGNTVFPMTELRSLCEEEGLKEVRTYIQSGNVVFESDLPEEYLSNNLEKAFLTKRQRSIPVMIRSVEEMESILSRNPFPNAKPSQVGVLFLSKEVPEGLFEDYTNPGPEEVVALGREVFIHYPNGMGRSKLKLPAMSEPGTMRNINTVARLVAMSKET